MEFMLGSSTGTLGPSRIQRCTQFSCLGFGALDNELPCRRCLQIGGPRARCHSNEEVEDRFPCKLVLAKVTDCNLLKFWTTPFIERDYGNGILGICS